MSTKKQKRETVQDHYLLVSDHPEIFMAIYQFTQNSLSPFYLSLIFSILLFASLQTDVTPPNNVRINI